MRITDEAVEAFTQYRRKQIAELRPYQNGEDMIGVSISAEDYKRGSPKPGDMIARNPKNHADQWLVAAAYFADNFEPLAALPHLSQGAVREGSVELVAGWDDLKDSLPSDHAKAAEALFDYGDKLADHLSALSPAPVGVTDEMVEIVAKKVADFLGYAWEGLNSVSVVEQGYRMFTHGQFGWSFHGGQPDLRNVARDLLEAALASREPATTDTQEVVAFLMEGSTVTWLQSTSGLAECDKQSVTPVPLVRQSALTACQQEVEKADANAMAWGAELKSAKARILELEIDLEIANDKLEKMAEALEPFAEVAFDEHADLPDNTVVVIKHEKLLDVTFTLGDFRRARTTLGGKSNG